MITEHAKRELAAANFGDEDTAAMIDIMERFFDHWDSGASVCIAAQVLQKLIAGKPLSPLTGDDNEWIEVGTGVFQNKRLGSVFKEGNEAHDLDNPRGPRAAISFPYTPS